MNAMLQEESGRVVEAAAHALAGQEMSGADIVVQVLADEGVDVLFG
jgi:acetolactate synthase-1/2/3 large subunit